MQGRYERELRSAGADRYPRFVSARWQRTCSLVISRVRGRGRWREKFESNVANRDCTMDGWNSWKRAENSFLTAWYQRVRESYVAIWIFGVFQSSRMSASTATGGGGCGGGGGGGGSYGGGGSGVGGALTLMGCVREASPPPQSHHQNQHHRTLGLGDLSVQNGVDPLPKGLYSLASSIPPLFIRRS